MSIKFNILKLQAAAAAKSLQSCLTLRPHRRQPTRLPRSWDSPGKNIGVGCHFLLQCMKVKSESGVTQSCPTLHDPMDCSLSGSSIHGIFQAKVLEWDAIAFSEIIGYHDLILNYIKDTQVTLFPRVFPTFCQCLFILTITYKKPYLLYYNGGKQSEKPG